MFKFICLLALASAACGASIGTVQSTTEKREIIPVLRFETDKQPDGSFSFMYEGGDKSFREESGVVENAGTEDEALEVHGSYRYIDADGQEIEVHYTAGKNGFVPVGTNIPAEITALARAAGDLPNNSVDEDEVNRRARSKVEKDDVRKVQAKVAKAEIVKRNQKVEKIEKSEQIAKVEKPEKVEKAEQVEKVDKPKEVEKPEKSDKVKTAEKAPEAVPVEVKTEEVKKPVDEKKSEDEKVKPAVKATK